MGEQAQVDLGSGARTTPRSTALRPTPADPGAGHLHVEDRVLHRLLPHRGQVEGGGLVERAHQTEDPGGVGADVGDQRVEGDGVAGPLAHLDRLVPVHQRDHLAQLDLEAAGIDPQGLDPGHQAGHLAVVVGAEDVDDPVEAPDQELVAVVGQVAGQVGGVPVGLAEDPVAGVAQLGGPEPGGAVLLEDEAPARPAGRWSRRRPRSPRWRPGCTTRRRRCPPRPGWPGCGRGSARPPTARRRSRRRGRRSRRPARSRTRPGSRPRGPGRPWRRASRLSPRRADLAAGVVDVVLAAHPVARPGPAPGPGRRRSSPTSRCPHGSGRWGWRR